MYITNVNRASETASIHGTVFTIEGHGGDIIRDVAVHARRGEGLGEPDAYFDGTARFEGPELNFVHGVARNDQIVVDVRQHGALDQGVPPSEELDLLDPPLHEFWYFSISDSK
jgi:hypothetical protein